jgi:hypothetical protein
MSMNLNIHLVIYGCERYGKSLIRIQKEALRTDWFSSIHAFTPNKIPSDVYVLPRNQHPRGGGYWAWKPYIIKETLKKIPEGDLLLYLDAGCTINSDAVTRFNQYVSLASSNDFLGFHSCSEKRWTKRDLLIELECDNHKYLDTPHIVGGIIFFKNIPKIRKFVDDWYSITRVAHFIDDTPSINENYPEFIEHRHDQSCLSLLAKKANLYRIDDETYHVDFSSVTAKKYPLLATRNKSLFNFLNHYLIFYTI